MTSIAKAIALKSYSKTGREYSRQFTGVIYDLASKTIINPKTTNVHGWIWSSGTLCASQHCINTLASCPIPDTVGQMRSFVGAYKVLSCVLPGCSSLFTQLDNIIAGLHAQETIAWTDKLRSSFASAQQALSTGTLNRHSQPVAQLPYPGQVLFGDTTFKTATRIFVLR